MIRCLQYLILILSLIFTFGCQNRSEPIVIPLTPTLLVQATKLDLENYIEVPYTVMVEDDGFGTGKGYAGSEPAIISITSEAEAKYPGPGLVFPDHLLSELEKVDYEQEIVLGVFQGNKPYTLGRQPIKILGVFYDEIGNLYVNVDFIERMDGESAADGESSPYSFIRIEKPAGASQDLQVVLLRAPATP